jgi:multidrug resistance efflux pump
MLVAISPILSDNVIPTRFALGRDFSGECMASPIRLLETTGTNPAPVAIPKASVAARILRVLVALPLLALSAWVLLPFAIVPVSIVAVTNARVSQVRSQGAGQVLRYHVDVGDRVTAGQELVEVGSVVVAPKGSTDELEKRKLDTQIQETALGAQIGETEQRLHGYDKEVREYTNRMIAEMELRLRQATRELESDRAEVQQLKQATKPVRKDDDLVEIDRELARLQDSLAELHERYTENHPDIQRVRSQIRAVEARRAAAAKTTPPPQPSGNEVELAALSKEIASKSGVVERLRGQIANLQSGYFVGPEQERPPQLGLRDEAAAALSKLREQRLILGLQDKAITLQIAGAPVTPASEVTLIRSSVDGIVWSRDVPGGQAVRMGENLIRIAETGSIQAEAYLDARYARRLSIGDRALIDLTSINKRVSGRLISVQAPAQRKADAEPYAIELKPPVEGLYRVLVQVDPDDRATARVGQVARVLFPGPDGSLIWKLYTAINRF